MSGKTGNKPTGRKPLSVRPRNARTDGAFGKETVDQVTGKGVNANLDKSVSKRLTTKSGEAA